MNYDKEIKALNAICARLRRELSTGGDLTNRQVKALEAVELTARLRQSFVDLGSGPQADVVVPFLTREGE